MSVEELIKVNKRLENVNKNMSMVTTPVNGIFQN